MRIQAQINRISKLLRIVAAIAFVSAAPAQASPMMLAGTFVSPQLLFSVGATGNCYLMTYDKNGNRISQNTTSINSSALTWGSSAFGCSIWSN